MTRRTRRPAWSLGVLLSAGVLAIAPASASALPRASGPPPAPVLAVSVSPRPVTSPRPPDFLGLALEYNTIPAWTAQGDETPNIPLEGLIRNLDPAGSPVIRIGGQSTDRTWWPVAGMRRPLGVTYDLTPAWAQAARALATSTGAHLMLGINLEANSPRIERTEADNLVSQIGAGAIDSLQLGNEPDLYTVTPWYRVSAGRPLPWYAHTGTRVYNRPPDWGPAAFAAQFSAAEKVLPGLPLAGPETGSSLWFRDFAQRFLARGSRVSTLTAHAYGLNNCVKNPLSPRFPSIAHLLGTGASRHLLHAKVAEIAPAHRVGASFRVDEMGSVTCNGHPGVSDTFASALWVMDALFSLARVHVDGVNLHSYPDSLNGLFDFSYETAARDWRASVHPIYDGVLMFAAADPPGARVLQIVAPALQTLRVWATLGADHQVRVLLINDATTGASVIDLHAPAGYGTAAASLQTLRAPGPGATSGILYGGHRFGSTLTGIPPSPALGALSPRAGAFTVTVPAASATLVTLSAGAGGS